MSASEHFCFDASDEHLHQPGTEPAWNESMAFAAIEADGPSLFIRHGRRYNEGHIEVSVAQLNADGSLDLAFAKRPVTVADIGDGRVSSGAGLTFRLIEPLRRWHASYAGTLRHVRAGDFAADPGAALKAAPVRECRFELDFEDRGPLFGHGPQGSMPGGENHLHGRHYESSLACSGEFMLDGVTRRVATTGFRDHSWGVRDMTRMAYTRWFWVQVDERTSCVGWAASAGGHAVRSGIIVRDGVGEVATSVRLSSVYAGPEQCATGGRLQLGSPNGDIDVELETGSVLPLRYARDGRYTRGLEFAARVKGTRLPAWMEYWDLMVDGVPAGNATV